MKCASTREIIEKLQNYEKLHGVGAIINISTICSPSRTVEYRFTIENDFSEKKYEEIEISSIDDTELFKKIGMEMF